MKSTTEVVWSCESIGKPVFNTQSDGAEPLGVAIRKIVEWVGSAHMGTRIEIRIARDFDSLKPSGGSSNGGASLLDLTADIEAMLDEAESQGSET